MDVQITDRKLDQLFNRIRLKRKEVASIHREFAAFPEGIEAHFEFYEKIILAEDLPLSRSEREYLAILSSEENSCQYCIEHHQEVFRNYDLQIEEKRISFYKNLVTTLSKEPWKAVVFKKRAFEVGLSSAEYAHTVMIIGYFNMANRLVFGLDIQLEENFKKTCQ
ncbi:MAG: hypothetical protein HOJ35_12340 [Bdellovibrionales bacterium]|jgi:alkylhydroperoxidase family enzyme|nr:hypothetical protein [Bdellovibrionales bacterium]